MGIEIGAVLEGKVTGITKFGAFVTLENKQSGLVHISEISNTYVNDIQDHLKEGQTVKVKVLSIDKDGRLNLSVKKALPPPPPKPMFSRNSGQGFGGESKNTKVQSENATFEDKLKQFMQDSEAKMSDLKSYSDKKSGTRRGRR